MYQVRIEHQNAVRFYQAGNQTDAFELFDLLTKTCRFVQVWDGDFLICEYKI